VAIVISAIKVKNGRGRRRRGAVGMRQILSKKNADKCRTADPDPEVVTFMVTFTLVVDGVKVTVEGLKLQVL
jgi:hypothetical protein